MSLRSGSLSLLPLTGPIGTVSRARSRVFKGIWFLCAILMSVQPAYADKFQARFELVDAVGLSLLESQQVSSLCDGQRISKQCGAVLEDHASWDLGADNGILVSRIQPNLILGLQINGRAVSTIDGDALGDEYYAHASYSKLEEIALVLQ